MVISLALLFTACMVSSFFEERFLKRDKVILYIIFGIIMILIAGLREVGSVPDTVEYEGMYYGSNAIMQELTEPTFKLFTSILRPMMLGVNALFMTYAFISIVIHLPALWKLSKLPLLTLTIYISYYYMMHEMVQMRAGVAAGLFLWAIYFYVEKKKLMSLACILVGFLFHYSAAAGLVLFLLKDKLPGWQKTILYLIIPVGLVAYIAELDLSLLVPDEFGGDKLTHYRELKDKGLEDELAGWPLRNNILIWINFVLYTASIYYSELLTKHCKYVPIAIKVQAIGFCFLFFAHGVSAVLGNRMNDYFSIATIILWTASVYAFSPRIVSIAISNFISTFRFVSSVIAYALALLFYK